MSMQLCLFSQRWRERRESYRPAGEPINPRLYEVAELAGELRGIPYVWSERRSETNFPTREEFLTIAPAAVETKTPVWTRLVRSALVHTPTSPVLSPNSITPVTRPLLSAGAAPGGMLAGRTAYSSARTAWLQMM